VRPSTADHSGQPSLDQRYVESAGAKACSTAAKNHHSPSCELTSICGTRFQQRRASSRNPISRYRAKAHLTEVYTGHSDILYFGRHFSSSTGSRYGVRTVCANCVKSIDHSAAAGIAIFGILILIVVIGSILDRGHTPSTEEAIIFGVSSSSLTPDHLFAEPKSGLMPDVPARSKYRHDGRVKETVISPKPMTVDFAPRDQLWVLLTTRP
jgi:hypothetical protein